MKKSIHPLQTKAWAEFRREWGNEVLVTKYGIITIHKIPLINKKIGMFIKGPEPTRKMLKDLLQVSKEKNLIFIRLEPDCKKSNFQFSVFKGFNIVPGKTLFTPTTFQIDLTKPEEELLKSFHLKTRYNIRYAQRKGVKVFEDNSSKAFETYLKLMRETVKRQGFFAHNEKYHRLMWKHLKKANIAHLLVAKYGKKVLTTWILFKNKDTLYYPYGASTFSNKNLQANSAMMWEAIKFGKKHKLKVFDLWGREEGKGFTKFKDGFNPKVVEFIGTWDLIASAWYWPYRLAEAIRWKALRLKSLFVKTKF